VFIYGSGVFLGTQCQVLGAGCPILFHESNFVELHGNEILKYRGFEDMKVKLANLFAGKFNLQNVKAFLEDHNAEKIGGRFIRLFEQLLSNKRKRGS
jgi:hypothetical protein